MNDVPKQYEKITWEMRLERTARDYGIPVRQWKSLDEFKAWWREQFGEEYTPEKGLEAEIEAAKEREDEIALDTINF